MKVLIHLTNLIILTGPNLPTRGRAPGRDFNWLISSVSHSVLIFSFFQRGGVPGKCFVLQNAPHMNGILPWQKLEENGGCYPLCPCAVLGLGYRVAILFSEFLPSILMHIYFSDLFLGLCRTQQSLIYVLKISSMLCWSRVFLQQPLYCQPSVWIKESSQKASGSENSSFRGPGGKCESHSCPSCRATLCFTSVPLSA